MSPYVARMRAIASELGRGSLDEVEDVWLSMWRAGTSRELMAMYPKQMKAIISFARMRAKGQIQGDSDKGYAEMIGKVVEGVGRR